ncbi:nuA3 HAT complex component nto1 [Cladochytrium tenue]|nr:nuA3 HAT complex component nto1 [Cladochytrium tenue]
MLFAIIANPHGGRGTALQVSAALDARLAASARWAHVAAPSAGEPAAIASSAEHTYYVVVTERAGHATEIAKNAIDSQGQPEAVGFILLGGDGLISEVISGVLAAQSKSPRVLLGIIPCGTGNALATTLGIKNEDEGIERVLAGRFDTPLGIQTVHVAPPTSDPVAVRSSHPVAHSFCVVSWGLHAQIVARSESLRALGNRRFLLVALFNVFFLRQYWGRLLFAEDAVAKQNLATALDPAVDEHQPLLGSSPHQQNLSTEASTFEPVAAQRRFAHINEKDTPFTYFLSTKMTHLEPGFNIAPHASLQPGPMDLVLARGSDRAQIRALLGGAVSGGKHTSLPFVDYVRTSSFILTPSTRSAPFVPVWAAMSFLRSPIVSSGLQESSINGRSESSNAGSRSRSRERRGNLTRDQEAGGRFHSKGGAASSGSRHAKRSTSGLTSSRGGGSEPYDAGVDTFVDSAAAVDEGGSDDGGGVRRSPRRGRSSARLGSSKGLDEFLKRDRRLEELIEDTLASERQLSDDGDDLARSPLYIASSRRRRPSLPPADHPFPSKLRNGKSFETPIARPRRQTSVGGGSGSGSFAAARTPSALGSGNASRYARAGGGKGLPEDETGGHQPRPNNKRVSKTPRPPRRGSEASSSADDAAVVAAAAAPPAAPAVPLEELPLSDLLPGLDVTRPLVICRRQPAGPGDDPYLRGCVQNVGSLTPPACEPDATAARPSLSLEPPALDTMASALKTLEGLAKFADATLADGLAPAPNEVISPPTEESDSAERTKERFGPFEFPAEFPPIVATFSKPVPKARFQEIDVPAMQQPEGVPGYKIPEFVYPEKHYFRYCEPTESDLDDRIEYDMDEQDLCWLRLVNEERRRIGDPEVPELVFELIVDRLEKEWFNIKEHRERESIEEAINAVREEFAYLAPNTPGKGKSAKKQQRLIVSDDDDVSPVTPSNRLVGRSRSSVDGRIGLSDGAHPNGTFATSIPDSVPRLRSRARIPTDSSELQPASNRSRPSVSSSHGVSGAAAYRALLAAPVATRAVFRKVCEAVRGPVRKKGQLVELVCRYWSLKRESRRGAPLLKRLHLEPWTAASSAVQEDEQMKRQRFEFLRHVRRDLERVRLLAELVKKREKEKLRRVTAQCEYLSVILNPMTHFLRPVLEKIKRFDTRQLFAEPVDTTEVTDYLDYVTKPMDFQTMTKKLENNEYLSLDDLHADVELICANASTYNQPNTTWGRAALRLREKTRAYIASIRPQFYGLPILPGGGLLRHIPPNLFGWAPGEPESPIDVVGDVNGSATSEDLAAANEGADPATDGSGTLMDGPPGTEEESSFRSLQNSSDSAENPADTTSKIHRPSRRESLRSSRAAAAAATPEISSTSAPTSSRSPERRPMNQTDTTKRPASGSSRPASIMSAIPASFSWQESGERRSPRLASLSSSGSQPLDAVVSSSRKTGKRALHHSPGRADESPLRRAAAAAGDWTSPELASAVGAIASGGSFDPREDRREKRARTASEQDAREASPRSVAHRTAALHVQDSSVRRSARIVARPAAVEPEAGDEHDDNDDVRSASGPGAAAAAASTADGAIQSLVSASEFSSQQTDHLASVAGKPATTIADAQARSPVLGKRQRQSLLDRWLRPRSQQFARRPDATGTDSLDSTSQRHVTETARELTGVLAAESLADEGNGTPAPTQDATEPQNVADASTEALPPTATRQQRARRPRSRTLAELERSTNLAAIAAPDADGDPSLRSPTDARAAEIALVLQAMAAAGSPPPPALLPPSDSPRRGKRRRSAPAGALAAAASAEPAGQVSSAAPSAAAVGEPEAKRMSTRGGGARMTEAAGAIAATVDANTAALDPAGGAGASTGAATPAAVGDTTAHAAAKAGASRPASSTVAAAQATPAPTRRSTRIAELRSLFLPWPETRAVDMELSPGLHQIIRELRPTSVAAGRGRAGSSWSILK